MEDDDDDIMLQNHHMIPERDANVLSSGMMNNMGIAGVDGANFTGEGNMFANAHAPHVTSTSNLGTQAEAAFNQQRVVVARLSREELEDR